VAGPPFGIREVQIRGFRSARRVHFAPGPMCALVGGDELKLAASPPGSARTTGSGVPVLFLPATLRSQRLVATPTREAAATDAALKYFAVDARPSCGSGSGAAERSRGAVQRRS
jgi:hypothetical protein